MHRIIGLVLLVTVAACGTGKDRRAPVINWPFPADKTTIATGDTNEWQAVVVDDRMLDTLAITFIPDFDSPTGIPHLLPDYRQAYQWAVTGDTRQLDYSLIVPDSTMAGSYKGSIIAVDAAGNRTVAEKSFTISNVLDGQVPAVDSVLCTDSLQSGSAFDFYASATDDLRLAYARWEIRRVVTDSVVGAAIRVMDTPADAANFLWPGASVAGQYRVQITVGDWVNNQSRRTCNLLIYQ